jgi:predicted nucleic acid-binding protein
LTDSYHVHHDASLRWFQADNRQWATCAITENGFLRIISHPSYPAHLDSIDAALGLLEEQCRVSGWEFWPQDVRLTDVLESGITINHSQLTDLYLLGLAAHHGGKLATLDSRINATAVRGGRDALFVIPA